MSNYGVTVLELYFDREPPTLLFKTVYLGYPERHQILQFSQDLE